MASPAFLRPLRRCAWIVLLGLMGLLRLTSLQCSAAPETALPTAQATGPQDGSLADPDIRYIGRWDKSSPTVYHGYWSGVYLRTGFTGTSVGIKLAERTELAVSIDSEPLRMLTGEQGTTALNAAPMKAGNHTLMVGSAAQNYEVQFQGLVLDAGATTLPVAVRPILEIVGDSISIGVGDGYGWLAGEMLGCDHVQIAFSARALTTGYGCADDKTGLDTQYFRLKNFNHLRDTPQAPWDFSYTPRIVVINLGQNDQCGQEPAATFTDSYIRFVQKLRARFPQAQIVALRSFGGPYEDALRKVVATVNTAGDKNVHFVDTTGWLTKPGDFRDNIHPNAVGNLKAAWHLANALSPLLNP